MYVPITVPFRTVFRVTKTCSVTFERRHCGGTSYLYPKFAENMVWPKRTEISPMTSVLLWDITQHKFVIPYRRCGTTSRSLLQGIFQHGTDGVSEDVGRDVSLQDAQYPTSRRQSETSRRFLIRYFNYVAG
jgi:hypothetical protein